MFVYMLNYHMKPKHTSVTYNIDCCIVTRICIARVVYPERLKKHPPTAERVLIKSYKRVLSYNKYALMVTCHKNFDVATPIWL